MVICHLVFGFCHSAPPPHFTDAEFLIGDWDVWLYIQLAKSTLHRNCKDIIVKSELSTITTITQ